MGNSDSMGWLMLIAFPIALLYKAFSDMGTHNEYEPIQKTKIKYNTRVSRNIVNKNINTNCSNVRTEPEVLNLW